MGDWVLTMTWGLEACFTVFHGEPVSALSLMTVWSLWGNPGMARCLWKSNLSRWIHPAAQSTLGEQWPCSIEKFEKRPCSTEKKWKWPCSTKIWETTMLHLKKWKLCIPPKFEKTTMLQQNYAGYSIEWQLPTFDKFLEPHLNLLTTSSSSVDSAHFVSA